MRRLLPVLALSLCACNAHRGARSLVSPDEVDELTSIAADDLGCPEERIETRALTLLTRRVEGCGQKRVYAFDPISSKWVLEIAK